MKRKTFNRACLPAIRETGAWVRVHHAGCITFSRDLHLLLDLDKNGLNFIQDEERQRDWYLEICNDPDAFKVRLKKATPLDKCSILQSAALAKEILKSLGSEKSLRFRVATEPIEKDLYAIITKSAETKKLKAA